eukprot:TRINITY_DN2173_c0_g1_i3.p1 TRINITY_DN2173_c0_g1~~TRINITY_DN2173_c0_g1_i3.p1  ORF type:complete len:1275 (-),score=-28.51 TRINITY_DN2173_c0_g1_i3:4-3828(-)
MMRLLQMADNSGDLVHHALVLVMACLLSKESVSTRFFSYKSLKDWLFCLVLRTPLPRVRKDICLFISALCERTGSIKPAKHSPASLYRVSTLFLSLLLSFLPQVEFYPQTCEQYFQAVALLLRGTEPALDLTSCSSIETVVECGSLLSVHSQQSLLVNDDQIDDTTSNSNGLPFLGLVELMATRQHYQQLLTQLSQQLADHPVVETNVSCQPDLVLGGLLLLLRTLVKYHSYLKQQHDLGSGRVLQDVFDKCLFSVPTAETHGHSASPKAKVQATREAAFKLLIELVNGCSDNFVKLLGMLQRQLDLIAVTFDWQYHPGDREKSITGYVGLMNLGATCYMNSLLQQLYLVPQFRKGILSIEDRSESRAESLLYQLQVLFANLQESSKRYFDTSDFCATIRDFEGKPVSTSLQMDCNEFGNMLFDKLETLLKGTSQEKLLAKCFGGILSNQFICKDCPHSSERLEPFYTLSVEVAHQKDIYESLKLFIAGEMLKGDNAYYCETCKQPVDTLKRMCIKTLPNTLFLHLKRFEFDYDKMKHVKVNDRCEFPVELNMEQFTVEGVAQAEAVAQGVTLEPLHPPAFYSYDLVGVIVHYGTVDSGHYYSFIKERVGNCLWHEYNDTKVLAFDPSQIPLACFGGGDEITEVDRMTGKPTILKRVKANNAYILCYQRRTPQVLQDQPVPKAVSPLGKQQSTTVASADEQPLIIEAFSAPEKESELVTQLSSDGDGLEVEIAESGSHASRTLSRSSICVSPSFDNFLDKLTDVVKHHEKTDEEMLSPILPVNVPLSILSSIWEQNTDCILEQYLFDPNYFSFVWALVNIYDQQNPGDCNQTEYLGSIQYATRFFMSVVCHARDKPMYPVWIAHLKRLYSTSSTACLWFLNYLITNRSKFKQILLLCPHETVRASFADLVAHVLAILAPDERLIYREVHLEPSLVGNYFDSQETPRSQGSDGQPELGVESAGRIDAQASGKTEPSNGKMEPSKTEPSNGSPQSGQPAQNNSRELAKSMVVQFLELLVSSKMLKSVWKYPRFCSQYFFIIRSFAQLGPDERRYLMSKQVISLFIEFVMGLRQFSSPASVGPSGVSLLTGMRFSPSNLVYFLELVATMVRSCLAVSTVNSKLAPPTLLEGPVFSYYPLDLERLFDKQFLSKMIRESVHLPSMMEITRHLCWESKKATRAIVQMLTDSIRASNPDQVKPFLKTMTAVVSLQDSIRLWRIDTAMLRVIDEGLYRKDTLDKYVAYLVKLAKKNEEAKLWLFKHKDSLNEVLGEAGYRIL